MLIKPKLPEERGRDYALRMLRINIVNCQLEPGSAVSENELAVRMGLSRTPVREAIIELAKVNIMEVYPQRSSRVALIDYALVDEAQFMRIVLECAVVESLAQQETLPNAATLDENLQLQKFYEASVQSDASDKLFDLDNTFHRLLFEACGKQRIYGLMDGLELHFDRVRALHLKALGGNGESYRATLDDHAAIYAAITAHDTERARATMAYHLTRYRLDQKLLVQTYPQYFKQS